MEKGLARFRVSLLCFCCDWFVATALLRCFVALRWQTAAGGPSHFVGPFPFREPMPPAAVCHLSAAGTPTASWHGDHAHKYSRGILAWRRGHLSTLWHGDPQQNHFCGRVTWQACLEPVSNRSLAGAPAGLRHGTPVHRCLCGIPAWRSGLQSTLRHSDPTHRYLSGIPTWRDRYLSAI